MARSLASRTDRLRWMPGVGLALGVLFSGRGLLAPHPFASIDPGGPSVVEMATLFTLGCGVGGVLVALFFPLSRWLLGATFLGMIAVAPAFVTAALADPTSHSVGDALLPALALILVIGGVSGFSAWFDGRPAKETPHWIYGIRYPTTRGVLDTWGATAIIGAVGWGVGLHWAGQWQALIGFGLFLVPLGFAIALTLQWVHHQPWNAA